jgi:DNA repair protein RecO (recombination protein O)
MTYKTPAIVLRSYNWPRNARLYILYTKQFGKIRAVAAGTQKVTSKIAGHLQPFCLTEVMLARGKSIERLAQARLEKHYASLTTNITSYTLGSYTLEVIERLTSDGVADNHIWEQLVQVLSELQDQSQWLQSITDRDLEKKMYLMTRLFAFKVLDRFGWRPELRHCLQCEKTVDQSAVYISLIQGGLFCSNCKGEYLETRAVSSDVIKLMRYTLAHDLAKSNKLVVSDQTLIHASELIDQYVSLQTQRSIKSAEFHNVIAHSLHGILQKA